MKRRIVFFLVMPLMLMLIIFFIVNYTIMYPLLQDAIYSEQKQCLKLKTTIPVNIIEQCIDELHASQLVNECAKEKIKNLRFGENKEYYFWIADLEGNLIVHPMLDTIKTFNVHKLKDANGNFVWRNAVDSTIIYGEYFMEYLWPDKNSGTSVVKKISYMFHYKELNWIIGSANYIENIDFLIDQRRKKVFQILLFFALIILVLESVIIMFGFKGDRQRRKSELLLKNSEERFRNLFHMSNDVLTLTALDGKIQEVNQKSLEKYGLKLEDLQKQNIWEMIPTKYHQVLQKRLMVMDKQELDPLEIELFLKKDFSLIVEIKSSIISINGENVILSSIRDLTTKKLFDKKLVNASIASEERERSRIAKELHDGLGPFLSTIKLYFQWLAEAKEDEKRNVIIEKGNKSIEEAITVLREVSNNLNPHILSNYGLMDAVGVFLDKFEMDKNLSIVYEPLKNYRFQSHVEIMLYRVIIELLNNTLKHASATEIMIRFTKIDDETVYFYYADNGKGFDIYEMKNSVKGIGLLNIEKRIETIEADYEIVSEPGKGMFVKVVFRDSLLVNR